MEFLPTFFSQILWRHKVKHHLTEQEGEEQKEEVFTLPVFAIDCSSQRCFSLLFLLFSLLSLSLKSMLARIRPIPQEKIHCSFPAVIIYSAQFDPPVVQFRGLYFFDDRELPFLLFFFVPLVS